MLPSSGERKNGVWRVVTGDKAAESLAERALDMVLDLRIYSTWRNRQREDLLGVRFNCMFDRRLM